MVPGDSSAEVPKHLSSFPNAQQPLPLHAAPVQEL
jgi:hypothetical protein